MSTHHQVNNGGSARLRLLLHQSERRCRWPPNGFPFVNGVTSLLHQHTLCSRRSALVSPPPALMRPPYQQTAVHMRGVGGVHMWRGSRIWVPHAWGDRPTAEVVADTHTHTHTVTHTAAAHHPAVDDSPPPHTTSCVHRSPAAHVSYHPVPHTARPNAQVRRHPRLVRPHTSATPTCWCRALHARRRPTAHR